MRFASDTPADTEVAANSKQTADSLKQKLVTCLNSRQFGEVKRFEHIDSYAKSLHFINLDVVSAADLTVSLRADAFGFRADGTLGAAG